jgi:Domain of unknown function (DUF6265)
MINFVRFAMATLVMSVDVHSSASAADQKTASLDDVAWLAGTWKSPANDPGPSSEETWSAPAAGAMMGMFRMYQNDRIFVYEFLMLEQSSDGIRMRLRHFRPEMVGVEDVPFRLKLTEYSAELLVFVNQDGDKPKQIVYATDAPGKLSVTVTTKRGEKTEEFQLRFEKVNTTPAGAKWRTGS